MCALWRASADGTIYANIHVGWIVRSRDGGETWENLQEGLEMDVHQVSTHPSDPEIVFAATRKGVLSQSRSWRYVYAPAK